MQPFGIMSLLGGFFSRKLLPALRLRQREVASSVNKQSDVKTIQTFAKYSATCFIEKKKVLCFCGLHVKYYEANGSFSVMKTNLE